jgi:hypothetical protein
MQLDVVCAVLRGVYTLVMVVNGNRKALLGAVLTYDVLIEDVVDLFRLRNVAKPEILVDVLVKLFLDDLVAELYSLVAELDAGARDKLTHLLLRLAAEAAF